MNKLLESYMLFHAKKIKAKNFLGGECEKCKETNPNVLHFHHKNPKEKEFNINDLKTSRWSKIEKEISKCILLCGNCHGEIHNTHKETPYKKSKGIFLEFKNMKGCEKCGYDKYQGSLHFHHKDPKNKIFNIGNLACTSIQRLSNKIKEELNKCEILCSNCHSLEHFDYKKFKKHEKEIYKKIDTHKELPAKYDRQTIIEMYKNGMRQIDISKKLGCTKSTVHYALKDFRKE